MTETAALPPPPAASPTAGFVRPTEGRIVGGVCQGIADHWQLDVTLVRVVTVVAAVLSGVGVAAYLAAWALTPSVDGPATVRPGSLTRHRLFTRGPLVIAAFVVAAVVLSGAHHLWFGAPAGLLVLAVALAAVVRVRPLRLAAAVAAALAVAALVVVGIFGAGLGTRDYRIANAGQLAGSYREGVGTVNLDLAAVQVAGHQRTTVHVGRGTVNLTVPASQPIVVHARTGLGTVSLPGHRVSGVDAAQSQSFGDPSGADVLVVDVVVGAGSVHVHD